MGDPVTSSNPVLVDPGPDRIRVAVLLQDRSPHDAFLDWTEPERLQRWWPPRARIEARAGGVYEFDWPKMNWHLRGRIEQLVPDQLIGFSWCWDHEPGVTKHVIVRFTHEAAGTLVTVEHGSYTKAPRDLELRQEHVDGWMHFLARLSTQKT